MHMPLCKLLCEGKGKGFFFLLCLIQYRAMEVYGIVEECIHASAVLPKERPPIRSLPYTGINSEAEEGSPYPRTPFLLSDVYALSSVTF
jgi:hypothetical protein